MPTFVKRDIVTHNAFWRGDDVTQVDDCTDAQKAAINAAFTTLMANPGLNCVPGLRNCMTGKVATIPVDCCVNGAIPDHGGVAALINICSTDATSMQAEIAAGLVRACGGHRLDVVAVLQMCFGAGRGTPSPNDFADFENEPVFGGNNNEREGVWVVWNKLAGTIFEKTTTSTDMGFWRGTVTTSAKGNTCFTLAAWVH